MTNSSLHINQYQRLSARLMEELQLQIKCLKDFNQKLEAEKEAKNKEIVTLYHELKRLTEANAHGCPNCTQAEKTIGQLKQQLQALKLKNKDYENQLKQTTDSRVPPASRVYRVGEYSELSEWKNKYKELENKCRELQNQLLGIQISPNLHVSGPRTANQDKKESVESVTASQARKDCAQASRDHQELVNSATHGSGTKYSSINKLQNDWQASKRSELAEPGMRGWTTIKIDDSDLDYLKIENARLREQNQALVEKLGFVESRVFTLEDWNKTLREEVLMKMGTPFPRQIGTAVDSLPRQHPIPHSPAGKSSRIFKYHRNDSHLNTAAANLNHQSPQRGFQQHSESLDKAFRSNSEQPNLNAQMSPNQIQNLKHGVLNHLHYVQDSHAPEETHLGDQKQVGPDLQGRKY